ncbi:hypothetical protein D0B54_04350 [Solimonas sp. K1W22B-7]|uniref:hypothetical protein n=1 Tax=Solimonas sp. K1W22B-7 TaxID=2303331 RepID=UPI000E33560D|nr:hypothetical protein [Solimonas sp. K1W22B-7]AXQ27952.1 hypothetical protein D0B54_04350 [Solimonas sp. K1W22B-7]
MSDLKPISYAEFGHNFIRQVVNAGRLRKEIEGLLQETIDGSLKRMPADLIVGSYSFRVRDVQVEPRMELLPKVGFRLELFGDMLLELRILNIPFDVDIDVLIHVDLDVETYEPLIMKLVPRPIEPDNVRLRFDGRNIPGELLHRAQVLEPLVREQIVRQANKRIGGSSLAKAATIDVLKMAQSARVGGKPAASEAPVAEVHGRPADGGPPQDTN